MIACFSICAQAQEMLGIANSNFAGNMGIFLNPSSIVIAPYKFEFNLLSVDVFEDNNYLFLRRNSRAIRKTIAGESISDDRFDDYYTPSPTKRVYLSNYIMGPSYIRSKGNKAWGVHLAVRNPVVAIVPYHVDR